MTKKKITQEEALMIVFEKIKPSNLPNDDYEKFRSYRNRYKKGLLKEKAINHLLEYFGFTSHTFLTSNSEKDKSINKNVST